MEFSSSKHFLTSLLVLVAISSSFAARDLASKTSTDFIRTSCSATTYPKLCYSSLSSHANSIQTSPQILTSTALSVTLSSAKSTSTFMSQLSKGQGMNPRVSAAMKDCLELLRDSVDELHKSIGDLSKIKGSNFQMTISNIQTWVSAALTDETTCTDGFEGNAMNGNVKTTVKNEIVNVAQLTSNALALINRYATTHG